MTAAKEMKHLATRASPELLWAYNRQLASFRLRPDQRVRIERRRQFVIAILKRQ